jgi:hypothetical protein
MNDVSKTIWAMVAILMVLWLAGVLFNFGPIIHVLLALAVILGISDVVSNRTRV